MSHISAASTLPREMPAIAPISDADDDRDHHRRETDRERDAPAVEHARQQVLAEIVGAERMLPRTALASRAVKSMSLIGTRQTSGPNSDRRRSAAQDHDARDRQAMAAKPSPRLEARRDARAGAAARGDGRSQR